MNDVLAIYFVDMTIAIYFVDMTIASAFVARWCASRDVEIVDGFILSAMTEPTSRVGAGLHRTP